MEFKVGDIVKINVVEDDDENLNNGEIGTIERIDVGYVYPVVVRIDGKLCNYDYEEIIPIKRAKI